VASPLDSGCEERNTGGKESLLILKKNRQDHLFYKGLADRPLSTQKETDDKMKDTFVIGASWDSLLSFSPFACSLIPAKDIPELSMLQLKQFIVWAPDHTRSPSSLFSQ